MIQEQFSFTDIPGQVIQCLKWSGNAKPLAVVQIIHGMSEHASRYKHFADFLINHGFIVYSNDHRGHGLTAGSYENTGYFADRNGWEIVTDNIHQLTEIAKKENPDLPFFLFGHSLGSLLARSYIIKYPTSVNGLILSGTSYNPSFLLMFGKTVANLQRFFAGKKHRSKLLDTLSFGSFNSKFKPARTKFDWLSRDEKEVDKYINDEFCGFICTASFYADMFSGILKIQKNSNIAETPSYLPIYLFSGELDAVGNFKKGVQQIADLFRKHGVKDIELKFYKNGRHEMLNEINKEDVYQDVVEWIKKRII